MRRLLILVLALGLASAACSKGESDGKGAAVACTATPNPITGFKLPEGFPMPDGVTITDSQTSGPSTVTKGYIRDNLEGAYQAFSIKLATGGYVVTKSEKEANDAEVNFAGGQTTGQVQLKVECEGRTSVRIVARPE